MSYAKIQDRPNLVRDTSTNAVLSVDHEGLSAYKKAKSKMQAIDDLQEENEQIRYKMESIEGKLDRLLAMLEYK